MDSFGSPDEEYQNKELDDVIQKEFIDLSNSNDEDADLLMMINI